MKQIIVFLLILLTFNSSKNELVLANINNYTICDVNYDQKSNNKKKKKTFSLKVTKNKNKESLTKDFALIKEKCEAIGIPYRAIIWLWLRESGWGQSSSARVHNVHFGVKCHGKVGVHYKDDCGDAKCCFRQYASFEESLDDLLLFLVNNPRYKKAGIFKATTEEEFVSALIRARYATSPVYMNLFKNEWVKFKIYEL